MKKVSPIAKGKSVKAESVKKKVEKAAAVVAEEFKQEKLVQTVKLSDKLFFLSLIPSLDITFKPHFLAAKIEIIKYFIRKFRHILLYSASSERITIEIS